MFILAAVSLAVAAFLISVFTSFGRRTGLVDLGSVSTQWLAEHRQYQEGDRSR